MKILAKRESFSEITFDLLKKGRALKLQAFGNSMYPTIRSGERLVVEPLNGRGPLIGEILFFKNNCGKIVVHRFLREKITAEGVLYLAQGDFFLSAFDWFPGENVAGKVTAIERDGKIIALQEGALSLTDCFRSLSLFGLEKLRKGLYRLFVVFQNVPFYPRMARMFLRPSRFRYEISREGRSINAKAFVGKKEAGGATLTTHAKEGEPPFGGLWIWGVFVRTRYRCLGIGKQLMNLLMEEAKAKGGREISCLVFEEDDPARRFYLKLGFFTFEDEAIREHLDETDKSLRGRRVPFRKVL